MNRCIAAKLPLTIILLAVALTTGNARAQSNGGWRVPVDDVTRPIERPARTQTESRAMHSQDERPVAPAQGEAADRDPHEMHARYMSVAARDNVRYFNRAANGAATAEPTVRQAYAEDDQSPRGEVQPAAYEWQPNRDRATRENTPTLAARSPRRAAEPNYAEDNGEVHFDPRGTRTFRTSNGVTYDLPPGGYSPQPETVFGVPQGAQPYGGDGSDFGLEGFDGMGGPGQQPCEPACPECAACCGGPSCPHRWLEESSIFAGVHSFKNGLDQGQNGNFGFQEGLNFAGSLWHRAALGYQVGFQAVQSNLSGSSILGIRDSSRDQAFLTAGLFHRPLCGHGLQGGAVYDWLDDRFYTRTRYSQVRAELSFLHCSGNEFGFWGAFGTGASQTQVINNQTLTFAPTDMYNFFYRKNLCSGGSGRIWGGFTGHNDGMVGADFRVPLSNRWDLNGGFNYLIPQEGSHAGGYQQESWGIAVNLVWYPTRKKCGTHNGPFRSLLPVADNNVFMINQVR